MTPLRQRMLEDMQLRGLAERTQEAYLSAVQHLALHYGKSPDLITEEELRQYFLFRCNEKHLAPNTTNVALNGIKFFYTYTLKRPWPLRDLLRPPIPKKLPVVLAPEEVCGIAAALTRRHPECWDRHWPLCDSVWRLLRSDLGGLRIDSGPDHGAEPGDVHRGRPGGGVRV